MRLITLFLACFIAFVPITHAAEDGAVGDAERRKIESIIRNYLMTNPEVLIEAVEVYKSRRDADSQKVTQSAIQSNRAALQKDPSSPFAGNPKGDVTIVEFFDYRCGYCKKMLPTVQELLKTDSNIRWVFKEYPILGPDSERAAQAAQAAWMVAPDKYLAFHIALMNSRGSIDEARILELARSVNIDPAKLSKAMTDPAIKENIGRNTQLAQSLQIAGTPAFLIGDKLLPGAADIDAMRNAIAQARAR